MTDITPRSGLPLLAAAQAQKHVTHNEALYQIDAFVCARILDRDLAAPPASPADGDTYLIASGGSGAWTGQDGKLAFCADGGWRFYAPFAGLVVYAGDEQALIVFNGTAWLNYAALIAMQNLPMVGVGTAADATNKLSVKSNAALFAALETGAGGSGDIRATLSKQASGNTASFLFQDAFSGRAEIGLTGDDDFHFKVSPDGSAWTDALVLDGTSGATKPALLNTQGQSFVDKGTVSSGTVTFDRSAAGVQRVRAGGNLTLSVSNWPPSGQYGELLLEIVNGGAHTLTWPAIGWIAGAAPVLQSAGTDFVLLWSRDSGATLYGGIATS